MKPVVVYYSFSGKTELVAKEIAKTFNTASMKIEETKKRSTFNAYTIGCYLSLKERGSEIKDVNINLADYDTIFIGSPLWAWKVAPAVNAFILQNDLKGKNVIPFVTMGGKSSEKAITRVSEMIKSKGGNVTGSIAVRTMGSDEEIIKSVNEQISKLK